MKKSFHTYSPIFTNRTTFSLPISKFKILCPYNDRLIILHRNMTIFTDGFIPYHHTRKNFLFVHTFPHHSVGFFVYFSLPSPWHVHFRFRKWLVWPICRSQGLNVSSFPERFHSAQKSVRGHALLLPLALQNVCLRKESISCFQLMIIGRVSN